jgi:hypothetical protein
VKKGSTIIADKDNRPVIQDFVALAASVEWELGQQYPKDRGQQGVYLRRIASAVRRQKRRNFLRRAAELSFTSLLEPDKADNTEPDTTAVRRK